MPERQQIVPGRLRAGLPSPPTLRPCPASYSSLHPASAITAGVSITQCWPREPCRVLVTPPMAVHVAIGADIDQHVERVQAASEVSQQIVATRPASAAPRRGSPLAARGRHQPNVSSYKSGKGQSVTAYSSVAAISACVLGAHVVRSIASAARPTPAGRFCLTQIRQVPERYCAECRPDPHSFASVGATGSCRLHCPARTPAGAAHAAAASAA